MIEVEGTLALNVDKGTPIVRPRGLYSPTETYVYDHEFRDMVEFRASDSGGVIKSYYFLVKNRWDELKGISPVPGDASSSRKWEQSSDFKFITAESIVADMIQAGAITADKMAVAGFNFEDNLVWGGSKFGLGKPGIAIQCLGDNCGFNVYRDNTNYVELFQRAAEWGLKGVVNGKTMFQLGDINKLGPFQIFEESLEFVNKKISMDGMTTMRIGKEGLKLNVGWIEQTPVLPLSAKTALSVKLETSRNGQAILAESTGYVYNAYNYAIRAVGQVKVEGDMYCDKRFLLSVADASAGMGGSCYLFNGSTTITLDTPSCGENQVVWFSGGKSGGYVKYYRDGAYRELRLLADEGAMFVYGGTGWNVYGGKR